MSSPQSLQTSPLDVLSLSCQNADGSTKIIIAKFSMPIFWGVWCWRPTDNHTFQKKKILKGMGPKELSPCFPGTKVQSIYISHYPLSRGDSLTFLLVCVCVKSLQSCPPLCDPVDCSPPGSSVHGSLWARILERIAMPSSRGSSQPRDQTLVSCISALAGGIFTTSATWEAHPYLTPGSALST